MYAILGTNMANLLFVEEHGLPRRLGSREFRVRPCCAFSGAWWWRNMAKRSWLNSYGIKERTRHVERLKPTNQVGIERIPWQTDHAKLFHSSRLVEGCNGQHHQHL